MNVHLIVLCSLGVANIDPPTQSARWCVRFLSVIFTMPINIRTVTPCTILVACRARRACCKHGVSSSTEKILSFYGFRLFLSSLTRFCVSGFNEVSTAKVLYQLGIGPQRLTKATAEGEGPAMPSHSVDHFNSTTVPSAQWGGGANSVIGLLCKLLCDAFKNRYLLDLGLVLH